jgi:FkbM family methyltransferase
VVVAVHPSLVALLATIDGITVVNGSQPLPATLGIELTASLLDLPRLLETTLDTVPTAPYLSAPPAARRPIGAPPGTVLKVGLAWAGAPDATASVPFTAMLPLAEIEGVALYGIQHGPRASDCLVLGHPALVTDLSPTINNFADIAGRISQLDLVIAADCPTAHLAAALGKPVWLLAPCPADPRWMAEGEDSPWYPTLRLFRQDLPGDWTTPVAHAHAALRALAADALDKAEAGARATGPQASLRTMLAAHLAAGDLFVDVEAGDGTFTFDAAAHPSGDVHVLALEPRPADAELLQDSLGIAGIPDGVVTVIAAAVGDRSGTVLVSKQPRRGRRVFAVPDWVPGSTPKMSLDSVLADHPEAQERRVVMRLGQDGWEAEILDGLWEWLALGRVAVLLWEHKPGSAAAEIAAGNGYTLWTLPPGAVAAEEFADLPGPVMALAPGLAPLARYREEEAYSPSAIADARGEAARLAAEGIDHHRAGRVGDASRSYGRALALDPFSADANANLGVLLRLTGRLEAAVACGHRALARGPLAAVWSNIGNALRDLGGLAAAEAAHLAALEHDPHNPEYLYNLALVRRDRGHAREAAALLEKVHAQRPDSPAVAWELAQTRLKAGDDDGGFALLSSRRRLAPSRPDLPAWDGSPPAGRTILVHDDGDAVDTLMLARFIPLLSAHGALVTVECVSELAPALASLPGVEAVVPRGGDLPACDLRVALAELPRLLGGRRRVHDVPYLHAPAKVAPPGTGPLRVGLAWGRGPRSCPPAGLLALAAVPGVLLLVLGDRGEALAALGAQALAEPLPGTLTDAVAGLDLVVGDPMSPEIHLAGALARPAWVALPQGADWRWPENRDDSPWYPTVRVFRQSPDGGWHDATARMVRALAAMAAGVKI